jgi:hypothetical protein
VKCASFIHTLIRLKASRYQFSKMQTDIFILNPDLITPGKMASYNGSKKA